MSKYGSNFIVNLCRIQICLVVMKCVTLKFLFQKLSDTDKCDSLSELYHLILQNQVYDATKVTAFQVISGVI
jgi:hypothetical protein